MAHSDNIYPYADLIGRIFTQALVSKQTLRVLKQLGAVIGSKQTLRVLQQLGAVIGSKQTLRVLQQLGAIIG
jgi:trimethylamine:corrinoid methyltransferase-like protein